jgi:sugar/nucleoside kinase (ribokinase family)
MPSNAHTHIHSSIPEHKVDICCIGHITSDKVVTAHSVKHMPGGTAWYFSQAVSNLDLSYVLVTALAPGELHYVTDLRNVGIDVRVQSSAHTVHFENIYGDNPDERTQNVLRQAAAFTLDQLLPVNAHIFHLGPLLANDISVHLIKELTAKGLVSLDVQGYLRKVVDHKVYPTGWPEKQEALQYVHTLKADEAELRALTGIKDVLKSALLLSNWGVKEIVITNGSKGSLIYADGIFYTIPAYQPKNIVDATGCGDTYMAGYLYQRAKGTGIQQSGEFAAAMAALKIESAGPFTGSEDEVLELLK